ncbi:hypothetical protein [Knoellia aerolata]|uniref:Uncharacterized protein n=1 Tax=Knoellia aerolata DSM 18566 TaxID=1385519 RepID=A0A0A0JSD5_9MICO|nr:hypothetical protein [Knoellia aerolata]KGN40083.1 hypothetical protein N801_16470 [Knoellia aerolata DSM 18566]
MIVDHVAATRADRQAATRLHGSGSPGLWLARPEVDGPGRSGE